MRQWVTLGLVLGVGAACHDAPAAVDGTGTDTAGSTAGTSSTGGDSTTTGPGTTGTSSSEGTGSSGPPWRDQLPPTPTLASPADGATEVALETSLCWNPVEDPDGEAIRYRVFVDATELLAGVKSQVVGFDGPCVGPLVLAPEHTYTWQVQAVEVDDPTRASDKSEAWTFTTVSQGDGHTVFFDDFDDDLGWTVDGDATSGAWVRGYPVSAHDAGALSQPGRCDGGYSCWVELHLGLADQPLGGGKVDGRGG